MTGKNRLRKTEATKTVLSARTSSSDRGHGVSKFEVFSLEFMVLIG
jgi:hypothetical protein